MSPAAGVSRFDACFAAARAFLPKYKVQKVGEVNEVPFSTISYYYDRAADVGLIGKSNFSSHPCRLCCFDFLLLWGFFGFEVLGLPVFV